VYVVCSDFDMSGVTCVTGWTIKLNKTKPKLYLKVQFILHNKRALS